MRADFLVLAPGQALFSEADFAGFGEALPAALSDLMYAQGQLVISDDDGAELGGWVDTFAVMVPAICLDGAEAVARGEAYVYDFNAFQEQARLSADGVAARVEGAEFGSFDCDRASLVAALIDCGARFAALMAHLPPADGERLNKSVEARLAKAQAAAAALSGAP